MTDTPSDAPSDATAEAPARREAEFDRKMLELLVCPQSRGVLRYDGEAQELISMAAHLAFPIRNGIPVMLIDEARNID